jgi:hydrophobic/amphiphilic exporter-1 (mainly G- bacteria), HAE1 family
MILSDISIKRPVFATILNLLIVVFGLFSLPKLAIEQYPSIDFPVVSVWVTWPGADPASVKDQILEPLERAVNGISGLDKVRSTAYPSAGLVVLQFILERDSDQAAQDVRDKVFGALGELPKEVETPIIQKFEIGGAPIFNVTLSAKKLTIGELSRLAQNEIRPKIQRIEGVASVELAGDRKREMHVLLKEKNLSSFGLTPSDIVRSIRSQSLDIPAGKLKNGASEFGVRVQKKIRNTKDLENMPVFNQTRSHVRVVDVAEVKDTIADEKSAAFIDQEPTILISIFKQSGGNTNAIANGLNATIERMNKEFSNGEKITIVTDNSKHIKGSIEAVELDLLAGALLAVLVVMLFLQDRRATIISALALPTAVIGTFAFLQYMNFTLNMMTTLGLSLSIGILIDDAIVVIENIYRHLAMGKDPKTAAKDATAEIGLAVFATTLTVCAVFVPVAFMDGIIGRFFFQFGLTVAFAVLVSLFVAFTLTPMLASKWLKAHEPIRQKGRIEDALRAGDRFYQRSLRWCLGHRKTTLLVGFGSFLLSLFMLAFIPVSFFPKEDESAFLVSFTLPENTSLEGTKEKTLMVAKLLKSYPGVVNVVSAVAASGNQKSNSARISVNLVKPAEREYTQQEIMNRVRGDFASFFKDFHAEFEIGENDEGGGDGRGQNVQVILTSVNSKDLSSFSEMLEEFIKKNIRGAVDVKTTKAKKSKEYNVNINLDLATDIGLNPMDIALGTRTMFEGEKIGQFEDDAGRYDIRVQGLPENKKNVSDISSLMFTNNKGDQLSLGSVSELDASYAPVSIERYDGEEQITVLANYTGKDLNYVISQIKKYVAANAPATISMNLDGEADTMAKSIRSMMIAVALAILLIYMILCAQYERYVAPLVIMMALPLSLTGAFGALLITGQFISVYTMIGVILLMGLVTKNGILH